MSYCYKSDLRCASPSAFESGIFCLLFLLLKKSRSPKALKATNENAEPNALDKHRMIRTERLFLIPP